MARTFIAVVGSALVLVACSSTLDMERIESEILQGIESQTDAQLERVDCPEEREAKEGDTFTCTAVAEDGQTAPVRVEQTSDDGDIEWELNP
jgi:hypothetical protein